MPQRCLERVQRYLLALPSDKRNARCSAREKYRLAGGRSPSASICRGDAVDAELGPRVRAQCDVSIAAEAPCGRDYSSYTPKERMKGVGVGSEGGKAIYCRLPFVMRYRFESVRISTLPCATAGEASVISPSEFLPSTLNSGPA